MKNLPIGKRFAASFGLVLAVTAVLIVLGLSQLQAIDTGIPALSMHALDMAVESGGSYLPDQTSLYQPSRDFLFGFSLLLLLVGLAVAGWLAHGILVPLRRAVDMAVLLAAEKAQSRINGCEETKRLLQALREMNDSLSLIVGEDPELSAQAQLDLWCRGGEAACTLEDTATSLERLVLLVRQNAAKARQANHLAAAVLIEAVHVFQLKPAARLRG
ncbi:hypothetical protein HSX11_20710 [Oxalobacteraceae bacterium]|nr:hypothetical protein [Oxalobacteraceae bacterium]